MAKTTKKSVASSSKVEKVEVQDAPPEAIFHEPELAAPAPEISPPEPVETAPGPAPEPEPPMSGIDPPAGNGEFILVCIRYGSDITYAWVPRGRGSIA